MANIKISELPLSTNLNSGGLFPIVLSGITYHTTLESANTFFDANDTDNNEFTTGGTLDLSAGTITFTTNSGNTYDIVNFDVYKKNGFFDYNDSGTTVSPLPFTGSSGYIYLTNDEGGSFTNKLYPPTNVTDVWDSSLNEFNFTELPLGSHVHYRIDLIITTTEPNQVVDIVFELGISGSTYDLNIHREEFKSAGTYPIIKSSFIYMGDDNTKNNPGKIKLQSDGDGDVIVNGWVCHIELY